MMEQLCRFTKRVRQPKQNGWSSGSKKPTNKAVRAREARLNCSFQMRSSPIIIVLCAAFVLAGGAPAAAQVTIDVATIPGGIRVPFQSHNQKVVQNDYGIFATRGDRESVPGHFWLNRSTDGGRTFATVYEEAYSVNPPTLETDEANNLYLIFPRSDSSGTRFMKFAPGNYTTPVVNDDTGAAGSGGKFASCYDRTRGMLYHATQTGYFLGFTKTGSQPLTKRVWIGGSTGSGPSYPHLFVDEGGVIHYTMTTADSAGAIPYETIRYVKSTDGGNNWKKMDGTAVSIPVSCDPDSPNSTQINLEDEDTLNTWLGNMHVKNGKVHFQYNTSGVTPVRQHYMRFNATTGVREIDSYTDWGNQWGNPAIQSSQGDGLFASNPNDPTGPLFAVGRHYGSSSQLRLVALVSYDNGSTWQNHAITPTSGSGDLSNTLLNNVGGCRTLTPDGKVIGSLAADKPQWATVYFYQFQASVPADVIWDGSTDMTWAQPDSTSWSGSTYKSGDNAKFLGSGAGTVSVSGTVTPGSVTVNSSSNYTFSGGAIGGTGTVSKTGTGTLTLSGANTYSGTTTISAGTLQLSSGANRIASGNDIVVTGTLDMNGQAQTFDSVTGAGSITTGGGALTIGSGGSTFTMPTVVSENGSLTKSGAGTATLSVANTLTGGVTIGASGSTTLPSVLTIKHSNALGTGTKTVNITGTGRTLKLDGSGGDLTLAFGISFNTSNNGSDAGGATAASAPIINVAGNNTINGSFSLPIGGGGTMFQSDAGTLTLAGNITPTTTGRDVVFTGSGNSTVSGVIANGSTAAMPVAKSGAGTLTLSGANTYTGPTTVSLGTLLVNGSLDNSPVTVSGGILGGSGVIGGAVSVQAGGTLAPGASLGTLTISNSLTLAGTTFVEVNASNGQRDFVQGVTNLTYGGSLVVTNLSGMLTIGQTFQLFSASGTKTGDFASVTPALTGGQAWSFNPANGVLSVAAGLSVLKIDFSSLSGSASGFDTITANTFTDLALTDWAGVVTGVKISTRSGTFGGDGNAGAPGTSATYDGIPVPKEARDDYMWGSVNGGYVKMEITGLPAGTYNVTVFEGRTTDATQAGKIWAGAAGNEPGSDNTGNYGAGGARTISVTLTSGQSLWFAHHEDNVGGTSGLLVRQVPGSATKLAFRTQPGNGAAGAQLSVQPVVEVQDADGNRVTTDSSTVTLAIGTNPGGGTLGGTVSKAAVAGVATFTDLSISAAGDGYTLVATDGALTSATSAAFNITANPPGARFLGGAYDGWDVSESPGYVELGWPGWLLIVR